VALNSTPFKNLNNELVNNRSKIESLEKAIYEIVKSGSLISAELLFLISKIQELT